MKIKKKKKKLWFVVSINPSVRPSCFGREIYEPKLRIFEINYGNSETAVQNHVGNMVNELVSPLNGVIR